MIAHYRPTVLGAIIGALIVTLAILALSARAAPADAGPPTDPIVAADHGPVLAPAPTVQRPPDPAAVRAPDVQTDPEGFAVFVWRLWRKGLVAPAMTLTLWALGLIALARWSTLARIAPWLTRGRALAATSVVVGNLGGLVPLAAAGQVTWIAVVYALGAGLFLLLKPEPAVIAGQTGAMITGMALGKDPGTARSPAGVAGDVEVPT